MWNYTIEYEERKFLITSNSLNYALVQLIHHLNQYIVKREIVLLEKKSTKETVRMITEIKNT